MRAYNDIDEQNELFNGPVDDANLKDVQVIEKHDEP
jgi:hypothetical protein